MATKGSPSEEGAGWPWSALGLAPTRDREAIHAAYAARKAALDAQVMRVSAFAELSEAREKALFLAAEMRRAVERGEEASPGAVKPEEALPEAVQPEAHPTLEVEPQPAPAFVEEVAIAPQPEAPTEPQPEPEAPQEPAPPRVSVPVTKEPEVARAPTEPASAILVDTARREDGFGEAAFETNAEPPQPLPTIEEEFREWTARLNFKKFWPFFAFPVIFVMSMCSADDDQATYTAVPTDDYVASGQIYEIAPETAIRPKVIDYPRANAMVRTLFGNGFDYNRLVGLDQPLAWNLYNRLEDGDPDLDIVRAYLRTRILKARHRATPEQALGIGELYLAWLQTAQAQDASACREVTSELFSDGVPTMREDWSAFEQGLAAQLASAGTFSTANTVGEAAIIEEGTNPAALPQWALNHAQAATGLEAPVFRDALEEISHPARCRVEITLLEAMLARPEEVTPAMIAAL